MRKISLKRDLYLKVTQMSKVFIIAEAGVNHNGSLELAKKLIDVAVEAAADAVKFQTFKADKLVSKHAQKADYQKQTTSTDEFQYEMIKKLELDENAHRVLIDYCRNKGIMFLSTPFDHDSIDLLNSFQMAIFKIPSGEITNLPYLRHIGRLGKEVILSTGMANLDEVQDALEVLIKAGTSKDKITVLHATTEYPCPINEVNLRAMQTINATFGVKVGYSDHTKGIEVPVAAVVMGACVIEKHFTLDRTMEGPDHKASLEPDELKSMVLAIRHIEQVLGDGVKRPSNSEAKNLKVARKSIVALRDIKIGEIYSINNLTVKRPGNGISPMRWDEVIGYRAPRDFLADELIEM
jgi:N,N'-diacetyllegionaminate synthase